jgi:diguanylate cyclase (GGDEF)-like protein/PAS domain S-box-containing protein
MTGLLLISSSLIALLGLTLLMLARIEPGHRHIGDWGWSHVCLAAGLALGVALVPPDVHSLHYRVQATVAVVLTLASIAFELSGAARYVGRVWRWRRTAPLFALALVLILAPALVDPRYGVRVAATILTLGAWTAAAWLWRAGDGPERFVALLFIGSGLVHLSGPLLDPLARSAITHVLGTYLHSVLAMSLILLSVRRAHQATTTMQGRLHHLYEQSVQGMLVVRDQRILFANPAVRRIFGIDPARDAVPEEVDRSRYLSGDAAAAAAERHRQLLAGERDSVEWEADIRRRDGSVVHLRGLSSAIDWPDGRAVLELMLDDTERQQARIALERQALHDELTNLPNRHAAMARLDALTALGEPFAVVSADLDRFQLVNESLGHEFGDALLRSVAERLRSALPPEALLARLGEDQFMAVLPGVASAAQVEQARQQWQGYFDAPFVVAERPVFVHVSCGLACYPEHGPDGAALLSAADVAMHRAKQQAGTTVLAYAPEMIQRARAGLDIEQALGAAIAAWLLVAPARACRCVGKGSLSAFRWTDPPPGP